MVSLKEVDQAGFLRYLKSTEGYRAKLYNPTGGSEENFLTIGYGHKSSSKAEEKLYEGRELSEPDATRLLEADIAAHKTRAQSVFDAFVQQLPAQPNKRKWAALSGTEQFMLTDIALNGGLQRFPKFMTAIAHSDYGTALKEHARSWRDQAGEMHPLTDRNAKFTATFFNQ